MTIVSVILATLLMAALINPPPYARDWPGLDSDATPSPARPGDVDDDS